MNRILCWAKKNNARRGLYSEELWWEAHQHFRTPVQQNVNLPLGHIYIKYVCLEDSSRISGVPYHLVATVPVSAAMLPSSDNRLESEQVGPKLAICNWNSLSSRMLLDYPKQNKSELEGGCNSSKYGTNRPVTSINKTSWQQSLVVSAALSQLQALSIHIGYRSILERVSNPSCDSLSLPKPPKAADSTTKPFQHIHAYISIPTGHIPYDKKQEHININCSDNTYCRLRQSQKTPLHQKAHSQTPQWVTWTVIPCHPYIAAPLNEVTRGRWTSDIRCTSCASPLEYWLGWPRAIPSPCTQRTGGCHAYSPPFGHSIIYRSNRQALRVQHKLSP